jgi:hypothetical protein
MAESERQPDTPQEKYEQQKREFFDSCTAERNRFITSKTEQSKTYDQTILTFSAGAIALSLTFVEKIAPVPVAPWLLYCAWGGFGLAILSVILSFVVSQKAFQNEIDWVDASWEAVKAGKTEPPERRANRYTKITEGLNLAAGLLFLAGFVFLVFFGGWNWPAPKKAEPAANGNQVRIELTGEVRYAQTPAKPLLPPGPIPPTQTSTSGTAPATAAAPMDKTTTGTVTATTTVMTTTRP